MKQAKNSRPAARPAKRPAMRPAMTASFILCYFALVLAAAVAIFLPKFLIYFMDPGDSDKLVRHVLIIAGLYTAIIIAVMVIVLIIRLLSLIRAGNMFIPAVVRLVTAIAWLVIAVGILFIPMAFFFPLLFAVAYVAVTVGMCILVVRGILKDAVALKEENDGTI